MRDTASDPQEKLPLSRRMARNLRPPTSATSDDVNSLGSDLCVARRTSHHELSLLSNALSLTTGVAALMHGISANSHCVTLCDFEKMC